MAERQSVLILVVMVSAALMLSSVCEAETATRSIDFTNQCPFEINVEQTGGNASTIPCTPSTTSAQANCPDNFICYNVSSVTNYCVPGTTTSKDFPIDDSSEITLTCDTNCKSGICDTTPGSQQWGQCSCQSDADCQTGQNCHHVTQNNLQCYWGFDMPGSQLAANGGTTKVTMSQPESGDVWASGNFAANLSCDLNNNCLSQSSKTVPVTLIEYTFQNDNDWYDISAVDGVNVPIEMQPVKSTDLDYQSDDPYRCMAAGGTQETLAAIHTFQKNNGINGNSDLLPFACANDYSTVYTGAEGEQPVGFNYVTDKGANCSTASDCTSPQVCGLSAANVTAGSDTTTCGDRLGYWNYRQLCAKSYTFQSSTMGVNCTSAMNADWAMCANAPGPKRSCFNSNQTSPGETCCGYEAWSFNGQSQPSNGDKPVAGVNTTAWRSTILPSLKPLKQGCPLAYSYPYDDPYSTFTCATTGAINNASYTVTFCPGGNADGVNPPKVTCTPKVPPFWEDKGAFTVSPPSVGPGIPKITVALYKCTSATECTDQQLHEVPNQANIYEVAKGTSYYKVTATQNKKSHSCMFKIPESGCIERLNQEGVCAPWLIAETGAWYGRSIQVPANSIGVIP